MVDPVIVFDPERHRYVVDGRNVLSVTQVLEAVGISDWSGVPDEVLWEAQQRGTMVHRAAHYINLRNLNPETVDERIAGYVEGWRAFRRDHEFNPTLSEHLVYRRITVDDKEVIRPAATDLEIVGQLDCVGRVKKNGDTVVDIKTGDETDAWGPQTATYTRALHPTARYRYKRAVVRLFKEGRYRIHWYPIRQFEEHWEVFRRGLIELKRLELATIQTV